MKKRIVFSLFLTSVFIFNGYLLFASLTEINHKRIAFAADNYTKAQSAQENEKLYFLVQSDLLNPSDTKKLEIADIYLKYGNFSQANFYLQLIVSQSGTIKYAENALEEGRYEAFDKLSEKISDKETKFELELFEKFSKGQFDELKNSPVNPVTDLGFVLRAINTRNYGSVPGTGAIVQLINKQNESQKTTAELNIAKSLLEIKQREIAKFLLERTITENPELSDAHALMAEYYRNKGNYISAIANIKKAISHDPSKIIYYEKGVEFCNLAGDNIEKSYFENRLKALEPLIK